MRSTIASCLFAAAALLATALLPARMAHADLILLLSDDRPSITGVAQAIQSAYQGKLEIHHLAGNRNSASRIAAAVQHSNKPQVVAIGLSAAQLARTRLTGKQVVFCQVLSHEKLGLVTPWMKGVSATPSIATQFRAWKLLDPNLHRIGVIASKNMKGALAEAQAAARANNLELIHIEAAVDREVPLALEQLAGRIQGLWLAPDSTILSAGVIREALSFSAKRGIQVLVFSPSLLKEGALLAGTADFNEIARAVLSRLKQASGASGVPGEPLMPLSSANLSVNAKAAEKFGLPLSDKFREFIHGE